MIKINDKYYIESDKLNYILMEKIIPKKETSKETYKNIGYYGNINNLKNALIEFEIKDNLELLNNIDEIIKLKEEINK